MPIKDGFRSPFGGLPVANAALLDFFEGSQFASQAFQLEKGDVLIMYTDGITETENAGAELWGQERLEALL